MSDQQHSKSIYLGWGICLLGVLFYAYEYLLRIEPSVMVGPLRNLFGYTSFQVGLLSSMYYFAYTPMQLVVGVLTDFFGPFKTLLFALFLCIVGSFVVGLEAGYLVVASGRFLIGFGSAFAFIGALKLATLYLPRRHLGVFAGFATAMGMLGALSGEMGLSHLAETMGWEAVIHTGTALGLCLFGVMLFVFRRHGGKHSIASDEGAEPFRMWVSFKIVFCQTRIWLLGLVGGCLFLSLSVFAEMWGVEFLRAMYHLPITHAAELNTWVFWGWLVGAPLIGLLAERANHRDLLCVILLGTLLAAGTFVYLVWGGSHSLMMARVLLFAFGLFCSAEILTFVLARDQVAQNMAATAMAFVNMLVMLGGLILQPLASYFLDRHAHHAARKVPNLIDFKQAMWVMPVGLGFACLLLLVLLFMGSKVKTGD